MKLGYFFSLSLATTYPFITFLFFLSRILFYLFNPFIFICYLRREGNRSGARAKGILFRHRCMQLSLYVPFCLVCGYVAFYIWSFTKYTSFTKPRLLSTHATTEGHSLPTLIAATDRSVYPILHVGLPAADGAWLALHIEPTLGTGTT